MTQHKYTRRDVLKVGTAALAFPAIVSARALGRDGKAPPSETVRVGVIGCGGRSRLIAEGADVKGFEVVAACDCVVERAAEVCAGTVGGQALGRLRRFPRHDRKGTTGRGDGRDDHARPRLDRDPRHADGRGHLHREADVPDDRGRPRDGQRRSQVQHGHAGRNAAAFDADQQLGQRSGEERCVWASSRRSSRRTSWDRAAGPRPPRPDVKEPVAPWWDVWTNQAELRPHDNRLQRGWAEWWDYDGGGLCFGVTGLGHAFLRPDQPRSGHRRHGPASKWCWKSRWRSAKPASSPPAQTVGGVVIGDTGDVDTGTDYHGMAKLTGPRAKVSMKFASGTELRLNMDGDRGPGLGAIFVCEKGKIEINRNKLASNPKEIVRSPDNPGPNKRPETAYHIENWIECIKSRSRCNADIEIGQRSSSLCYLVNIVRDVGQVGKVLKWDPVAERFTNCDEANAMLSRPRRKGYELPKLS